MLDAFRRSGHTVGVSRLSELTGLPKSTVHRVLNQLGKAGYVVRSGSSYRLSIRAFELGSSYIHCTPAGLVQIARPHLGSLFLQTQCIVSLFVNDGEDMVLLEALESIRFPVRAPVAGTRFPALTTAAGKAVAAFLDAEDRARLLAARPRRTPFTPPRETVERQLAEIVETGMALGLQEAEVGVVAAASPVLVGDLPIAAVSATGPVGRIDLDQVGPAVLRTCRMIQQDFVAVRRRLHDYGPGSPHRNLLDEE